MSAMRAKGARRSGTPTERPGAAESSGRHAARAIQPPADVEDELEETEALVDETLTVDPLPELVADVKPVDVEPTSSLH
jgi:hypothetical protein